MQIIPNSAEQIIEMREKIEKLAEEFHGRADEAAANSLREMVDGNYPVSLRLDAREHAWRYAADRVLSLLNDPRDYM
jgi:hypothetical protein